MHAKFEQDRGPKPDRVVRVFDLRAFQANFDAAVLMSKTLNTCMCISFLALDIRKLLHDKEKTSKTFIKLNRLTYDSLVLLIANLL